jgi:hypothetical protein
MPTTRPEASSVAFFGAHNLSPVAFETEVPETETVEASALSRHVLRGELWRRTVVALTDSVVMTQPTTFHVRVDQNPYLLPGGRRVDALVSVTASGSVGAAPTVAQVIMIDCSSSMMGAKLVEAKRATAVALDTMRDGTSFAIVAGTERAALVYPRDRRLVAATDGTRAEAKAALGRLVAGGGTAIGSWLELADELMAAPPARSAQLKHAILLTDGRNEHQSPEEFRRILEDCRGHFVCDALGVGDEWEARVLVEIADVLLGSARGLPDPSGLVAEFRSITEVLMGKTVDVSLRLWTPRDGRVHFLRQVYPRVVDLTDRGVATAARVMDYPTGHWGPETRDFHLSVDVPAGTVSDEVLAARVGVVAGGRESESGLVRAVWTEDLARSARIDPRVAHYSAQAELAAAIEDGLGALSAGDAEVATAKLGRAVQLAGQSGREDFLTMLGKVVSVVDASAGTVRLQPSPQLVDMELVEVASRTTVRSSTQSQIQDARPDQATDLERHVSRRVRELQDAARVQDERVRDSLTRRQHVLMGDQVVADQGGAITDDPPRLAEAHAHTLAVSIYVADDEGYQPVEDALEGVLNELGLEITHRFPEIRGSRYRAFVARTKKAFTSREMKARLAKLERAIELQAIHRTQAEIDAAQSKAVSQLLKALDGTPSAIIQIGSILLIKVDGVPSVRNLTQLELAHLERNPAVFRDPAAALRELQHINHEVRQISKTRPAVE